MLQRHKIPTIFNIYMLDVICCALGCVVLLWQVAHQEAEQQTADAKEAHTEAKQQAEAAVNARLQYEKAQQGLLSASNDVTQLQSEVADWKKKQQTVAASLASAEKERDDARKLAANRLADFMLLETDLANAKKKSSDQIAALQIAIADADAKSKKDAVALLLSEETARKLQKLLDTLDTDSKSVQAKLKLADLQLKMREQDLDRARKDLAALSLSKETLTKSVAGGTKDLVDAKAQIVALAAERDMLKKEVGGVNLALDALRIDKDKLNKRIVDMQAEADQRFAGIPLTGENIVFLIDISGSMALKDGDSEEVDPNKWPFLCETVMQLMKSLPNMRRFQVIVFSDNARHLFGNRDSWLKYEGPATAQMTRDALRKVEVKGGTNMEEAFDEGFRYRKIKLDTIYLFSDGLPNIGAGVPANIANPTEAQRNQYMGKFVRDKLKSDWNRPQQGLNDVRINAVGFYFDSPDVGAFLWSMAREHRGSFVGLR